MDDRGQATIIESGMHPWGMEMEYKIYDEPGEIAPWLWELVKGRMRNSQASLRVVRPFKDLDEDVMEARDDRR